MLKRWISVYGCKINTPVNHYDPLFYYFPHCDDDANSITDNTTLAAERCSGILRSSETNKKTNITSAVLDKITQG